MCGTWCSPDGYLREEPHGMEEGQASHAAGGRMQTRQQAIKTHKPCRAMKKALKKPEILFF